jgi:peroxiredoxin
MLPDFQRYGVELLALSGDSVDTVSQAGQARGYSSTLLADPEHEVMRSLGLQHRGLRFKTVDILDVPFGFHTGFEELFLPASVLVDEAGIVRWIDVADDYRIRGEAGRILTALEETFPEVGGLRQISGIGDIGDIQDVGRKRGRDG